MTKEKKIVAIIPARGGSKGVFRKNVKNLAGKPMIAYIIEAARRVKEIDRIIVSTEDAEIAEVAKKCGAEVPFVRPAELAGDDVPTLPVLQHALAYLEEKEAYAPDYALLVCATSPLLKSERIQEAIDICLRRNSDSVISGCFDTKHYWIEREDGWKRLYPLTLENRQKTIPLFKENGAIYLTRASILKKQIVADTADILIMEPEENIDVDDPEDFEKVRCILEKRS